jgi:hypothetical protein
MKSFLTFVDHLNKLVKSLGVGSSSGSSDLLRPIAVYHMHLLHMKTSADILSSCFESSASS